jgi:hypothetical protein
VQVQKLDVVMNDEKSNYRCPACSARQIPIFVHAHYQCPVCKTIVESCCGGAEEYQKEQPDAPPAKKSSD